VYSLFYNEPLGRTMRKIIPFFWDAPSSILDVTAGKKLIWRNWLGGFNNGNTLVPDKDPEGYEVTFMDIMPQSKDVLQGHAWALPFADDSFDMIVCDFPFTPSLMDDRLNDSRVRAHYNHPDGARLYYQNSEVGELVPDISTRTGGATPTTFLRDHSRTKTTPNEQLYMGEKDRRTRRKEHKGQADRVSKDPIDRFKHANMTTGSHLSNPYVRNPMDRFSKSRHTLFTERWNHYRQQSSHVLSNGFVPPLMNFENTWREFNRVARKGLIVKIGEYHKDFEYFPGDMEAFACFDKRANPESDFQALARIFYKGVRPMVHQVPHPQPVVTFYVVFKKKLRER